MAGFRYWFGLLLLAMLPGSMLYWIIVHPLAGFWRRLGPKRAFWIVGVICALPAILVILNRDRLMAIDFGTQWVLVTLGLILVIISSVLRVQHRRFLTFRILAGVPELSEQPGQLLTKGIYSKIRHPRYVEAIIGLGGWALVCNHLSVYLGVAACVPALGIVIWLEEKELRARFGEEYEEYERRVPRFIPRLHQP